MGQTGPTAVVKKTSGPRTPMGKKMSSGNSLKSGGSSPLIVGHWARKMMEHYIPILREAYPWLGESEEPYLEVIAQVAAKLRLEEGYVAKYGEHDGEGHIRPQALRADRLRTQLANMLEKVGGTPQARVSLGIKHGGRGLGRCDAGGSERGVRWLVHNEHGRREPEGSVTLPDVSEASERNWHTRTHLT